MTEKQIDREISYLSKRLDFFQSLLLPIASGVIIASVSKDFIHNIAYISLASIGTILLTVLIIAIVKLNKQIQALNKL